MSGIDANDWLIFASALSGAVIGGGATLVGTWLSSRSANKTQLDQMEHERKQLVDQLASERKLSFSGRLWDKQYDLYTALLKDLDEFHRSYRLTNAQALSVNDIRVIAAPHSRAMLDYIRDMNAISAVSTLNALSAYAEAIADYISYIGRIEDIEKARRCLIICLREEMRGTGDDS